MKALYLYLSSVSSAANRRVEDGRQDSNSHLPTMEETMEVWRLARRSAFLRSFTSSQGLTLVQFQLNLSCLCAPRNPA